MKRLVILAFALLSLAACKQTSEVKVMARAVPERADDFVFENDLVAGRFYGEALEGNPTSPGIDIWVKKPGALVADEWYKGAQEDPDYYHHDHGGKDCYKVAVSLGGGASAPLICDTLRYPSTNYRSYEILEQNPAKVVFVLHYPEWEAVPGIQVTLDKKVTVRPGTYFCDVEDTYVFSGSETLTVAAGINRHPAQETIENEMCGGDRYAIWEHASDQSIEPENGMLGVAVIMKDAHWAGPSTDGIHGLCTKQIRSGEVLRYKFGSCWSKGDIKTCESWFETVNKQ